MLALEVIAFAVVAAGAASLLSLHDARQQNWYRAVGYWAARWLILFDVCVAVVAFLGLTLVSGYTWHTLAVHHVVEQRTRLDDLWSLLLLALTASASGLAVITVRMPAGEHKPVLKRFTSLRNEMLIGVRSSAARYQTIDHCETVLPALKKVSEAGGLKNKVVAWAPANGLQAAEVARLTELASKNDDDSLLTLTADICNMHHGRGFLDDLIGRPSSGRPKRVADRAARKALRMTSNRSDSRSV